MEQVPGAAAIAAHVDLLPVRIGPVRLPPALDRLAIDQFEQPDEIVVGQKGMRRVAGEGVVEDLLIVRSAPRSSRRLESARASGMCGRLLLAAADDRRQRRVVDALHCPLRDTRLDPRRGREAIGRWRPHLPPTPDEQAASRCRDRAAAATAADRPSCSHVRDVRPGCAVLLPCRRRRRRCRCCRARCPDSASAGARRHACGAPGPARQRPSPGMPSAGTTPRVLRGCERGDQPSRELGAVRDRAHEWRRSCSPPSPRRGA